MSTARPRAVGALVAVTAALALTACGGDGAAPDATGEDGLYPLTVMQITTMDAGPLHLAVEEGFFEEQGLDVEVRIAEAGSAIVPSVVNQESPIGYANVVSDLQAIDQGLDIKFVANCCGVGTDPELDTSRIYVLPDGQITDLAGLAGANIAVNSVNNLGDLTIKTALEANGVDTSAIEFTPMNYSDMPAALERGDVDAIWSVEPHKSISDSHGFTPLISNFVESFPGSTIGYYITSGAFAQEHPDVVAGFQAAMDAANEFATQNPERVREVIVEQLQIDPELVDQTNLAVYEPGLDEESVATIAAVAVEYGIISAEPDYDEIFVRPQG
ncbi:ABC transporter substrate-binding protein [Georgenia faecalis]|uniref:ABC transporter substrate-binding protein n=1 Tax=Georgenia faecalis TaxID=2483799 RepID=A0ABV9D9Z7_9MICO|nr:ABC transporter substrate-binding protein [Georgenia faecalis]